MSPRYYVRLSQAVCALAVACRNGGEFANESHRIAGLFGVLQSDLQTRYKVEAIS